MRIALGADHAGYRLKEEIKRFLRQKKIDYHDFGTYNASSTDFPDWGIKVAEAVAKDEFERGILVCGTGLGMCLVANKVPGIRATPCYGIFTARLSREHNNSNILVLGARITAKDLAVQIVEEWLAAEFMGGRHQGRLKKLAEIEKKYSRR
ncbi:MAG: ribose 5-phosphate isomerase B [bacterium]